MPADAQHPNQTKTARILFIALLVIIALGAALRVYKLGSESLWLDEAYSIKFARESPASIIETTAQDVHPPLYYFSLHYWIPIAGDSEFAVRLLSVLFGILALLVIYLVATRMFDRSTGLLSAGLLALSRFHIEFSQEARMYSLLFLLTLLSFYFFLKLLEGRKSRYALAGYIITSALMMYTHVYSFFIIAAENLYWLTLFFVARDSFKRLWKQWLAAQVILAALFVPWLSVQLQQFSRVQQGFWIPQLPPRLLLNTLVVHAGSNQLAWILAPLIALSLLAGWKGWKEENLCERSSDDGKNKLIQGRLKIYLLLLWLLCPIMLPYIVSQFSSPIFLPKYTIAALPAFIILAARGLLSLRFHQLRMILVLLLITFSLATLKNYFGAPRKDMWREAVATINGLTKPNDLVLFDEDSGRVPFDYYYKRNDLIEKPFPDYHSNTNAGNLGEHLRAAIEGHDRVWLVLSHPDALTPLIPEHLARLYDRSQYLIIPGVEMYLFEKRK